MHYNLTFSKGAQKDLELVKKSVLRGKVKELLEILEINPFQNPPPYEALKGNFKGLYSRRINGQHRLVYTVDNFDVKVFSLWTHYENL